MPKKFTFFTLIALFNLAANYAHPVTPTYFKLLGLNDAMFGIAFAMMSLGMFAFSPFFGQITSTIHNKTAMAWGSVGYALAQILFSFGHYAGIILIGRLLAGIACAAFFVGVLAYITEHSTTNQVGTNLTLNVTVQTVFSAGGYFIGGVLGQVNLNLTFLLQIGQLALAGLLMGLFLDKDAHLEKLNRHQLKSQANPLTAFLEGKEFITAKLALLFGLSIVFYLGYTAFDQSFNYYLKDFYDLPSSVNGFFKGGVGLLSLILNLTLCLYLINQTKVSASLRAVLGFSAVLIIGVLFSPNLMIFLALALVFYGVYALTVPLIQELITQAAQEETRNQVLGFYQATQSLGMIIGALMAGFLYDFSAQAPFFFALVCFLLAGGATLRIKG